MDQLQQARAQIDEIDAKMAALFEQRMQAVGQVAQYKARTGKQVFDPAREALVLEKNTARVQNPELQPYYREFLKKALAVSRAYQHVLIGQDVAAYQGVEGAWSHIALRQLFPFAKAQAYSTWNEVVEAVERGDAYCGVLPFENSNAGDVSAVLDLLYAHPGLKVARMCDLPIRQDLLALPGAQVLSPSSFTPSAKICSPYSLAVSAEGKSANFTDLVKMPIPFCTLSCYTAYIKASERSTDHDRNEPQC